MEEKLSSGTFELYRMLGITPPTITKDMSDVRLDAKDCYTDQDLIDFLKGKKITDQSLLNKPPAMDDN